MSGNLVQETDQSDRSNHYSYDKVGRLLTAKNALDLETKYSYDEAGNLAKLTKPSGATTTFDYTTLDQLKTIKTPTGRTVESSYDPVGQVTKRTINGKRETTYTYDPNGNLLEETNPLGQVTKRTYDSLNRLTSESDTAGQWTKYGYDHDNHLTKITDEAGGVASMTYDANGNLTSVTSGSKRVKTYTYDLKDQLLTATQGSGEKASTSSYTYDSVGNVTSVTNGNGKVTSYSYDQLSNLVERMTSLGDKETYTYNVNNQLEKVIKSDGKTISYDYNKLDQLLKVEYSEKQDGQVLYTYDADGRRVSMSDLTGTSQYATNEEGEITGVRQGDGSLIQYEYDAYGNISKMIYPDGSTVSYTYDELDRLTSVTDVKGQKTSYSYNTAGDLTEVDRGDGTKSFLTYDKAHRLTELRHMDKQDKLISSYGYEYDDGGYIAKETIKQDGETLVHTYTYDTLGQVENMTVSDASGKELSKLSYTYDLAGNKLTSTETVDGKESQTRFTYDDHNRLTKLEGPDGTITYTYDKNGNRIASEKNSEKLDYIYDTENRLLAIKDKKGLLMAALYDGDDNRVFTASRKEGKNTYQLFQRKPKDTKSGRKSPYTAPSGEENSLFWYGFSQNVLQALSTLPQTVGSIWHSIFDDVSRAYHQKVAKDRASKEGIMVNPPELGNLPGQGEVTYASQVQDVLIPYTTREDTYNYYEERNYVNDINREHTEVLETYDHDGKARETYSYGKGRASYLNNQTGDSYNYLTNQSGSVTGLTKDGQAVASSSYNLYGARKTSTDTTGNPFAYNGESRDDTGLDYLRARYYDSQGGTFLTEDSYPGEVTDPLSQNRYSYVQNNPVNYTDPSGHRMVWMGGEGEPSRPRSINTRLQRFYQRSIVEEDSLGRAVSLHEYTDRRIRTDRNFRAPASYYQAFGPNVATYQGGSYGGQSSYAYAQQQAARARAQAEQRRRQQIRYEYGLATGIKSSPTIREGLNLLRNWGTALQNTLKHVCNPKTTGASDKGEIKVPSVADFRKYEDAARYGLTVSEKANIDSSSLSELKNKYGNVLGNYNTYQGTGYFNPQGSPRNRYIISRYEELKAIEDARVAQKVAEMNKYHYTNLYKHIAETGNRIDGTPASDLEKAVAPYVPWIAPIQDVAAAIAGRQVAKYNSSIPTGNGQQWSSSETVQAPKADVNTSKQKSGSSTKPKLDYSQNRKYWKAEVEFKGNKVYQRDDLIDPNIVSSWKDKGVTVTGTNVERMASGRAPIGPDGKSIELHHTTQRQTSSIAETTYTFHKSNSKIIHINPNTISSGINRSEFKLWRENYWENRANDFIK
ncbi:HNH/ENDO VII family nuclease [Streptococcus infantis]|uniref:HNH/ENDO VII family nuclease n=1 Tax=Streptococcus infantis TaxID=68892 RepID=UPI0039C4142E